ncbi:MAG: DOMON-like domain-containing protein [Novosphingobium sp.]
METCRLVPHPDHPPLAVTGIAARIGGTGGPWLRLRWIVEGAARVVIPPFVGKGRADDLWRTTCFELFVGSPHAPGYVEFNLSPSERWAAYDFAAYREGMANRAMPRDPVCTPRCGRDTLIFDADLPMAGLPPLPWVAGMTAVIEEEGGIRSYWALRHPDGKADFHHRDCLAIEVPAPEAP